MSKDKICAIVSYCSWVMFLIAFLITMDDNRSKFLCQHLNQAIGVNLIFTISIALSKCALSIFAAFTNVIGAGLLVWGVINAAIDDDKPIPVIGEIDLIKN